jgi:hypothetical protein
MIWENRPAPLKRERDIASKDEGKTIGYVLRSLPCAVAPRTPDWQSGAETTKSQRDKARCRTTTNHFQS